MTSSSATGADDHQQVLDARLPIEVRSVSALLTAPNIWTLNHVASTGSTNADLVSEAAKGAQHGLVLVTEEQVDGRGRAGRVWSCPAGAGLMFSVVLRLPGLPVDRRGWLGATLGLSIVTALRELTGLDATLKWPNDVLISGRKCGGILGEVVNDAVVMGSGINITLVSEELPRADATSLLLEGARQVDRARLLAAILNGFGDRLDRLVDAHGDVVTSGIAAEYRLWCATITTSVRLELPGGRSILGRAVDVDPSGALVIETLTGERACYSAGDIVHLRSAATDG